MQGTILIVDSVSTNRIVMKVLLSAAWYRVVQHDRTEGLAPLVRRVRPDLIVTAMSLTDGDAVVLRDALSRDPETAAIPILAVTAENDRQSRLRALAAGIDDVLSQPVDDTLLRARIRSLLRARDAADDLPRTAEAPDIFGFAEPVSGFARPVRIALVAGTPDAASVWPDQLAARLPHSIETCRADRIAALMSAPPPDAIVVDLAGFPGDLGPDFVADLRARKATRGAVVIAVTGALPPGRAAEALDRGADAVIGRFCAEEIALRLRGQLRRMARAERMRGAVRDGLRAATTDPLTGLFNRRYALPHLARVIRDAAASRSPFAVMLADLDHFKRINDRFGHPAGDAVLRETALRLRSVLRDQDIVARVGGEEFLIVLPNLSPADAALAADRLRCRITATPYEVPGADMPVWITISVGAVIHPQDCRSAQGSDRPADGLIALADRALYDAKEAGRNQVSLVPWAA